MSMSHPKIIRMNQNTGREDDDVFVYVTGRLCHAGVENTFQLPLRLVVILKTILLKVPINH